MEYDIFNEVPPPGEAPTIDIRGGSQIRGGVAEISQLTFGHGPSLVHVEESTIELLGVGIGYDGAAPEDYAELRLTGGTASFAQYLLVGAEGSGQLKLAGHAVVNAGEAYVNVGDLGYGFMHVTENSVIRMDELNVAVFDQGDMAIDSGGKVYSTTAHVGMINGYDGNVNVEGAEDGASLWETQDVTVGSNGTGYVYVRNNGTLRIDHEGVLGLNHGGRGVLNLIGENARLQVDPEATFAIGKEGVGELNLSQGAKFASAGDVSLGEMAGGGGIVTVDGRESQWIVEGELSVGVASLGRVEVRNKGKVTLSQSELALGTEEHGNGS